MSIKNKLFRRFDKLTREELCHMVIEDVTTTDLFPFAGHNVLLYAVTASPRNITIGLRRAIAVTCDN